MTPELAAIIARDYAQMPEPNPQPEEYYDELARKRAARLAREDERLDDPRRDL